MSDVRYTEILPEEAGQRLDNYLIRILKGVPKSHIYRIIRGGEVRVNKKRAAVSTRLEVGDRIRIPPVRTATASTATVSERFAQRLQESIIYEDNGLLVINKPAGMAVHGGSGLSLGLIEALRQVRSDLHYMELVHRLDKETSGCLLVAKKRSVLREIQAELAERKVQKTYWTLLLHPWQGEKKQLIEAPLLKNTLQSGERMVRVDALGKPAETQFRLLENYEKACWVEASPKTGRTHQIRVHAQVLGHAIVGDEKYGDANLSKALQIDMRLYLHARSIQFNLNGEKHYFEAKLEERFSETLKQLRARSVLTHG